MCCDVMWCNVSVGTATLFGVLRKVDSSNRRIQRRIALGRPSLVRRDSLTFAVDRYQQTSTSSPGHQYARGSKVDRRQCSGSRATSESIALSDHHQSVCDCAALVVVAVRYLYQPPPQNQTRRWWRSSRCQSRTRAS
jgi:hypothetical protein